MISFSMNHRLAVFLAGILLSGLSHTSLTQIVLFGGSLLDTGNLFQTIGSSPPACFNDQFSDGQV